MTLVIDASVVLRWFIEAPGSEAAVALLDREEPLIAPELVVAEVANAAWKLSRAGEIDGRQARETAGAIASSFSALVPLAPLAPRAFEIATALDHPVYDCLYIALAEAEDAALVTADDRLARRLARSPWKRRLERFKP